jgi:hypothetical protein
LQNGDDKRALDPPAAGRAERFRAIAPDAARAVSGPHIPQCFPGFLCFAVLLESFYISQCLLRLPRHQVPFTELDGEPYRLRCSGHRTRFPGFVRHSPTFTFTPFTKLLTG